MPTQERQQEHIRLSELLKALGLRHYEELPKGSVSLSLTVTNSKVDVKAFDGLGKQLEPFQMTRHQAPFALPWSAIRGSDPAR